MFFRNAYRPMRWLILSFSVLISISMSAGDLRLSIPKNTKATPVQKLNQDGVKAVQKHDYDKAKKLFYKAYLIDPNDPFTLNNLGYVAELEGEIERAQRYYSLAAENTSDALIYRASDKDVEGKPVSEIAGNAADRKMLVNRLNVEAMSLLLKDRAPEADVILQRAYGLDPRNPFTLNNLGFAKEKEGEVELALHYYMQSAGTASQDPVIVTVRKEWRGRPISEVASENVRKVQKQLEREEDVENKVARLNLRGVSAINRNERKLARQYIVQAYKLDPNNAFTLNNMGYLSELEGDRETANFFYAKAKIGDRSRAKVAVATRADAEGMRLNSVASNNDQAVDTAQQTALEARRGEGGPAVLHRRDNTAVAEPAIPVTAPTPRPENNNEVLVPDPPVENETRKGETVIKEAPANGQAQPAESQRLPAPGQSVQPQPEPPQQPKPAEPAYDGGLSLPK